MIHYKGEEIQEYKALIPGCPLASFLANYNLRECDYYFDMKSDVIYGRYSDDILILDKTREEVDSDLEVVKYYLDSQGLTINPDKYQYFSPGEEIQFLGLKLRTDKKIDISDHSKYKIKKYIHNICRKGRVYIERDHEPFEKIARKIIRKINNKNFFCMIDNDASFCWATYSFPKITTIDSIRELDFYTMDTIRAMKTGRHNKANAKKMSYEEFNSLRYLSLVEMYRLYKTDYDYYVETVEINKDIRAY